MAMRQGTCQWCDQAILWVTPIKGAAVAIDPDPTPKGTVLMHEGTALLYRSTSSIQDSRRSQPRYTLHAQTCPHPEKWK